MAITATYISATSFSVVGDQTDVFHTGRRIKAEGTNGPWFGTILTAVYTSLTTVTLTTASEDIDNTLTGVLYGVVSAVEADSSMPVHDHDGDEGSGGQLDHTDMANIGSNTHSQIDTHLSGDGSDHADVATNTAHISSNGTDHSYIDQDVTSGSSPTLDGTNFTGIGADQVEMDELSTATYDDVQDWANNTQSAGIISGGVISDSGGGEIDISAITGILKTTNSVIGANVFFDISGATNQSLSAGLNYVAVDYNSGTPQFRIDATSQANGHTIFNLGKVYQEGTSLDIITSGLNIQDFAKRTQQHHVEEAALHFVSGATVAEVGTRNISITAGVMYAGLNRLVTDAVDTTGADDFEYYYYTGAAWSESSVSQIDNAQYNDVASGLAALSNNQYGIHWVYKGTGSSTYVVYGQDSYTLVEAQSAQPPSSLPEHVDEFGVLRAKIIVGESDTNFTEVENVNEVQFTGTSASDHGELTGLQGGTANEYYHLTSAQHTDLTDAGDSTLHYHATDRARANHTGTQAASTISDFDTEVANNTAVAANTAKETNATHTGDVTGDEALTIAADAVTYAKMQNVVNDERILGRVSGADGVVEELTKTQVLTMLNVEDGADVTDTTNVTAAGALMDSEVDEDIKTLSLPASTTISAFGASLIDDAAASNARTTLDVDQAGTDNSTDVTLSGTPDYITISGQVITRNPIVLTTDVSGELPDGNIASATAWDAKMDDVVDDTTPELGGDLDWSSNGMKLTSQTVGGSNGDLVYLSAANTWSQVDADAEATCSGMFGIRISSTEVLTQGVYTTTGLTAAAIYYASTTAGGITATAPSATGDIVRIVGYALSTTEFFFDPDKTFVEIA